MEEDPHDIVRRNFDTEDQEEVKAEITRLWSRKRIGLKANFTRCVNNASRVMSGCMYGRTNPEEEGQFDTSRSTRDQIESSYQKLSSAYEKLSMLHDRVLEINLDIKDTPGIQAEAQKIDAEYSSISVNYVSLKNKISSQKSTQVTQAEPSSYAVKPMQALEPHILSFDNNPIEMTAWMIQYRAYYKASKFHKLDLEEQHAFANKSIHTEVWQHILQKIDIDTPVFHEREALNQSRNMNSSTYLQLSIFDLIAEGFDIKYPIITRRLEFFNSKRQGSQSFSDWFAKLKEMELSAGISEMRPDELLVMRICTGINDQSVLDCILAIPNEDFKLEEIQRLCVRAESARNFTKQMKPQQQQSHYTECNQTTKYQHQKRQNWIDKHRSQPETNNDAKNTIFDKLRRESKCLGCGEHQV